MRRLTHEIDKRERYIDHMEHKATDRLETHETVKLLDAFRELRKLREAEVQINLSEFSFRYPRPR